MLDIVIIVLIIIGFFVILGKGIIKDYAISNRKQINGLPYWTDKQGYDRLKINNKRVDISIDSEGHYIATDKKGNRIDLTFENEIKPYIINDSNLIWKYGINQHAQDQMPGQRYIAYQNNNYEFYIIGEYKGIEYYINIKDGIAIRPTNVAFKREERAKELGLEYYTKPEMYMIMDELNDIPLWKRKITKEYKQWLITSDNDIDIEVGLQKRRRIDYDRKNGNG